MKINNFIAIGLFVIVIVAIGRINSKVGYTVAGIVLLGTVIVNKDNVTKILNGGTK